jgi:hypothetical protein
MVKFKAGDRVVLKDTKDFWQVIDPDFDGMALCRRYRDDKFEKLIPDLLMPAQGSFGDIPQDYFDPNFTLSPVISAGYGAGKTWLDVTEKVREQYRKGRRSFVASNEEFGHDPYLNVAKFLCIVLVHNNSVRSYIIPEWTEGLTIP